MSNVLYNLSWLSTGETFPPEGEVPRLERYRRNRELFENDKDPAQVYPQQFKRIERVIGNFEEIVSYGILLNYQKKISIKTADLLFCEPPTFMVDDKNTRIALERVTTVDNNITEIGYQSIIDVSRCGDSVLLIKDGGRIAVLFPDIWYKVVDPMDISEVVNHVLAYVQQAGKDDYRLKVQIHSRGYYEEREYKAAKRERSFIIGAMVSEPGIYRTGLEDFAVIHNHNIMPSDRAYGIDDYADVDSIICEIDVRIAQIAKVLDKHQSPTMQGPMSALEMNHETGRWNFRVDKYFPREDETSPKIEYVTWNASLEASFKAIETLINMLAVISEMGSALFDTDAGANVASAAALRLRYVSPLTKVRRLAVTNIGRNLCRAVSLATYASDGIQIPPDAITIKWNDGLPDDGMSKATELSTRLSSKPSISLKRALMEYDGMNEEQADKEVEAIMADEAMANPAPTMADYTPDMPANIDGQELSEPGI